MTKKQKLRLGLSIIQGLEYFARAIERRTPLKITTLVRIPHAPKRYLRIREKKPLR